MCHRPVRNFLYRWGNWVTQRWRSVGHLVSRVEEVRRRSWLAELRLGDPYSDCCYLLLKIWGMVVTFCLPRLPGLQVQSAGRSLQVSCSLLSKIKLSRKPEQSGLQKLCSAECSVEWSSSPVTSVSLTCVFVRAEQGVLLLPKIWKNLVSRSTSWLSDHNWSSSIINVGSKMRAAVKVEQKRI